MTKVNVASKLQFAPAEELQETAPASRSERLTAWVRGFFSPAPKHDCCIRCGGTEYFDANHETCQYCEVF